MLIANLRTSVGLVNGAVGTLVGVVLRDGAAAKAPTLRASVDAKDVYYAVVDIPTYTGPVVFPHHPTWVPIAPLSVRHKRFPGWHRTQLPLVLAWGITIHKSLSLIHI